MTSRAPIPFSNEVEKHPKEPSFGKKKPEENAQNEIGQEPFHTPQLYHGALLCA